MEQSQKLAFLKDEYMFPQSQYEDFDKRSLSIKGWVASGSVVALALGLNSSHKFAYACDRVKSMTAIIDTG